MSRGAAISRVILLLLAAAATALPNSIVFHGGFEAGNLNGWTPFTTANGTLGSGQPKVATYWANGVDPSYGLQFQVGQGKDAHNLADYQGGGIERSLHLSGDPFTISADVTVQGLALANLSAGVAQLLLDNTVVASHDFGAVNADEFRSATLVFSGLEPAGTHLLAIQFLRPTLVSAGTPYQYIQAVNYTGIEAPEPHSLLLLSLGLAVLAARGRKVVGPNPARAHFFERNRVRN